MQRQLPTNNAAFPLFEVIGLNVGLNQTVNMERFHQHDEIEINFVEQGAIAYSFAGKTTLLEISQFALFWAATPHRLVSSEKESCFNWLTIPLPLFLQWGLAPELVRQVLQGEMVTNGEVLTPAQTEIYKYQFRTWHRDLHTQPKSESHQRIVTLELQALLHRLNFRSLPAGNTSTHVLAADRPDYPQLDKVEQMARYIAENHTLPLSIRQIAAAVGLHPNYAMRVFHKVYGLSVLQYLTQHRLAHAQRLLATTDQPVMEVAFASGINSVSRFYTIFKENCGVTPVEYRKSLRP